MTIGRRWLAAAAALAAGSLVAGGAQAQKLTLKSITIGSNPAGSVYYLLAGGFAKTLQQELKVRTTAQPHAGSSVYIPLLERGEMTLGLNSSLDSAMARSATAPYAQKYEKVTAINRFWELPYAYIVKASSPIKTMEDLKGKRVLVNVKTNVSLYGANKAMLATAGLDEKDVNSMDSGGVVAGINAVVEDRADAATVALGMPQLVKAHASTPGGIRVLPLGSKGTDDFVGKRMRGLRTMTVEPAKRLPMIDQPKLIGAFDSYLNAGTTVTDDDAYLIAKALHTSWDKMQKDYGPLRGLKASEIVPPTNVMPYHPGAIKYYREAGVWTAANDKHEAQFK
jgi:TRAP transporter TAXI family solute receptor